MMDRDLRKETGKRGEDLAVAHLKKAGYRIIERNYRCTLGEIDIVAKDDGDLVFVEVRSVKSERFGEPQESIGIEKRKKLSRLSLYYLQDKGLDDCNARFDIVSVKMLPSDIRIEVIKNAFDLIT
jgi:Predicted endonuclease distantly related to archaeal Holliday junction resolvase